MSRNILECAACFRRAVQGLPHGSAALINAPPLAYTRRQFATVAAPATSVDAPRALEAGPVDKNVAEKKARERLENVVRQQMRHMTVDDPYVVGKYVDKALARGAFDEALLVVQKASKGGKQMVLSWNHLIDYQLKQQQMKRAFKVFNDMKKRGQLPNVQTYTIIFRGLAKSQHPKLAVHEAVKHYNVLLNNNRLEANSTHLNAVLNVCARAGDLDSLFLIVNSLNESTRSPTAHTYTTILDALRHSAMKENKDLPEEQKLENIAKQIYRAKGLWEEIIQKWTAGRLVVDEQLVCAMGRLLSMSPKKEDKVQVLDLVNQTMNIPKLIKAPEGQGASSEGSAARSTAVARAANKNGYVAPGANVLDLILTTLIALRQTTAGIKYWNYLIHEHHLVPDGDNWLRLFILLKVAKASGHASSVLQMVPDDNMNVQFFRLALETCLRDNLNQNAVKNATKAVKIMLERLPQPDLHALRLFLRVPLVSHNHLRAMAKDGRDEEAKRQYGRQISDALALLWEPYKQMHYHYFSASKEPPTRDPGSKALKVTKKFVKQDVQDIYNGKREVIALARLMVGAYDKLSNEKLLPAEELATRDQKVRHAKINREIYNFFHARGTNEPELPFAKQARVAKKGDARGQLAEKDEENAAAAGADDAVAPKKRDEDVSSIDMYMESPGWVWDTYKPMPRSEGAVPYPWERSRDKDDILSPPSPKRSARTSRGRPT